MICQGIAYYIRWIPFDKLGSALRRGFAAFLRKCSRVNVYLSGACPDKYIFDGSNRFARRTSGQIRTPDFRRAAEAFPIKTSF